MSQLNTLDLRDQLIQRVTDFALDEHFVRDPALTEVMRDVWSGQPEHGGLGSELWVEGAFSSRLADDTLEQVARRGLISMELAQQLDRTGEFPLSRQPYAHQLASLEAAHRTRDQHDAQPTLVVTAGTGAGKTESFLLPMLDRLWSVPPAPGGGVSSIILYPMNALVNDQVGRLDKWLDGQSRMSFFHFTSETPENARIANDRNLPPATAARFRTRQQARGQEDRHGNRIDDGTGPQPQILVTNYSMLEYMLCRPQDAVFFGGNLRVIVLDEAHIYTGNLAAEITLLLRRVQLRCGRDPQQILHIATSATMGGGTEELRSFAARLFSKEVALVNVIQGERTRPPLEVAAPQGFLPGTLAEALNQTSPPADDTLLNREGTPEFVPADDEAWNRWAELLPLLVDADVVQIQMMHSDRHAAPLLAGTLRLSPAMAKLQEVLWADGQMCRLPLPELTQRLFGTAGTLEINATRALLQLGATARQHPSDWPLVSNRLHYLMRGPEGLLLSFRRRDRPPAYRALEDIGCIFSAGADPAALGEVEDHPLTLMRCTVSGWWGVAARQEDGRLEPVPASIVLHGRNEDGEEFFDPENPDQQRVARVVFFSLTEIEGATRFVFDLRTGRYSGQGDGVPLWEVTKCPVSGLTLGRQTVGWFAARARLQLSVVAETALAAMPEFPHPSKAFKPARGRRLLVFSDSRTEAARLGPRLTRQHELQVFRAAVVHDLERMTLGGDTEDAEFLRSECERLEVRMQTPGLSAVMRQSFARQLAENQASLEGLTSGGSVQQWAEALQESVIVDELFHAQTGEMHNPNDDHHQQRWQANGERVKTSLISLLGRELARRPIWPQTGLETMGLVEVVYPGLDSLEVPPELAGTVPMQVAEQLHETWTAYVAAILDALRNQGCVTLGSEGADDDYQFGGALLGKYFSARDAYRRSMIPLIGDNFDGERVSRRNAFTLDYLIAAGMDRAVAIQRAREVMNQVFSQLQARVQSGEFAWLELRADSQTHGDHVVPSLRIRFPRLGLRRPARLFRCADTGQVWPRSVLELYPGASRASLEETGSDTLDMDARIGRRRRELREWPGFRQALWAEEHSAQLSPQENARLQDLFRIGMRNILSSTTTLELGIDIGGLSAVLMGNLPPGKANYLQRAGRAGRRADGSSAVLGFARPSPYEREVFLDFRRYLEQPLRQPTNFLDRAAIVRRHAHAWLLGEFFQRHYLQGVHTDAMGAYGKMGPFTGAPLPAKWNSDDPGKPPLPDPPPHSVSSLLLSFLDQVAAGAPTDMMASLRHLWCQCPELEALLSSGPAAWTQIVSQIRREFENAIRDWREDVDSLTTAWQEVQATPPAGMTLPALRAQANAIFYQLRTLHQMTVIEALADTRVLPRYGFPIGLCRLHVQVADRDPHSGRTVLRNEDQFRLQRDSMMAMREYVPGSQLLAGGKIVTSRGLLKHWTGAMAANESWGLRGRFIRTSTGYMDYETGAGRPTPPPNPATTDRLESGEMIFPKAGFCTSAAEPPRHGSDFEKIGKVDVYTLAFNTPQACDPPQSGFGGIAGCVATYRHGGELLLLNSGENGRGFAICQKCGYADSEWNGNGQGGVNLPSSFQWHSPLQTTGRGRDRRCWTDDTAPVWRRQHLAAKQTTHLLRLDFSRCGRPLTSELLTTLGQALRLAAAELLEQDVREIRTLRPVPDPDSRAYRSVILYDTLAGGAGHLAQLCHLEHPGRAGEWIERARDILTVSEDYPPGVREREAMRRVLTADAADEVMVPMEALAFLQHALAATASVEPIAPVHASIPDDAWTLERMLMEEPPEHFRLWYPAGDVAGVGANSCSECARCTEKPNPTANIPVILRYPALDGGIAVGRWYARQNPDNSWQVRLRKTEGVAPIIQLSQAEYDALTPLATIIAND
jgi:DEAD/DEAH box helicase domain-containing protein